MIVAETITSVSPVEVSGWDEDELFFVEKSLLSSDDITGKQITLQHNLYDQRPRVRALEEQLLKDLEFHGIVGKSPAMLEVFDFTRKVARHYTNVLLVGPTGAGKEFVARAIHQISPVGQQRLAVCNCSAMVDTLL